MNQNDGEIQGIENPDLVAAIKSHYECSSDATFNDLISQLQRAKYLTALMENNLSIVDGVVKEGSRLSFGLIEDEEGRMLLPLFTDWIHLSESSPGKDGFVLDASWAFSMGMDQFDGVVINHTRMALPIYKPFLEKLVWAINA